jgi:hypothetical protein
MAHEKSLLTIRLVAKAKTNAKGRERVTRQTRDAVESSIIRICSAC